MVTNYDGEQVEIPKTLPMLPVRDIVVFPYMIMSGKGYKFSIQISAAGLPTFVWVNCAKKTNEPIFYSPVRNLPRSIPFTPKGGSCKSKICV